MKTVIYMRHAKSSWSEPGLIDKKRKLNNRGKRDAPMMANNLNEIKLQVILCSSSERTKETIKLMKENGLQHNSISYEDQLYHASKEELIDCVYGLDIDVSTVLVCAHNPGLSYLAFQLEIPTDNIPTAGVFEVKFDCEKWSDVSIQNAKPGFYIYPKMFLNE